MGLVINDSSSCLISNLIPDGMMNELRILFPFPRNDLVLGFKYLRFHLKPNYYKLFDWIWIFKKIEAHISLWSYGTH